MNVRSAQPDDICMWGDEITWCFWESLHEMTHMSDDFRLIPYDSREWWALING